jgi:hypothetical protein
MVAERISFDRFGLSRYARRVAAPLLAFDADQWAELLDADRTEYSPDVAKVLRDLDRLTPAEWHSVARYVRAVQDQVRNWDTEDHAVTPNPKGES